MMTVLQLRKLGLTVKVRHNRRELKIPTITGYKPHLLSKGGFTEVNIYKGEELLGSGIAKCSVNDNYSRKRGVQIALGRALKYNGQVLDGYLKFVEING